MKVRLLDIAHARSGAKGDTANALKYYKYALQLNPKDAQLANFVQRLESATAKGGAAPRTESDMAELTNQQFFNLLLADIAMAAAIRTVDGDFVAPEDYQPGKIRTEWIAAHSDEALQRRVFALANAGLGSLQGVDDEQLTRAADKYGVPIDAALAENISQFFAGKRQALLRYRS